MSRLQDWREDVPTGFAKSPSDGFGERLLMFADGGAPTWEVLRLRRDFGSAPGVGAALQRRVDQLAGFDHPSFPAVRVVEQPGQSGGFLLMSAYTQGRRLSELDRARSATFAMTLIRDLTLPLVALQKRGEGVRHGSLTAERILVTPSGRLIIWDHLLGAVLDRLALPATQLWSDLGILRAADRALSGPRLDVIHVALVALSSVLGRPIVPADYPDKIEAIVDQHVLLPPLRQWLLDVFELNAGGISSAEEAQEAMCRYFPAELPGESQVRASLAVFGGKADEPRSLAPGRLGLSHFLEDEGGTAFLVGPDPITHHDAKRVWKRPAR